MSDHELRDLLHRVVPDPPAPDPLGPVALARRWRSRRRTGLVVGVAALVAGVLVTVSVVAGPDERPTSTPPAAPAPTLTTEPYDANTCPAVSDRTATRDVDLDDVVAIVLCGRPFLDDPQEVPFTPDAYVDDMAAFARLADTTPALPADCRTLSSQVGGAFLFRHRDGTTSAIDEDQCETVRVAGAPLLVRVLHSVFNHALDRQRDRLSYAPRTTPPGCDGPMPSGPAEPGRERIVAAVLCSLGGRTLHRLDDRQVADLQRAWAAAEPLPDGSSGYCPGAPDDFRSVVAATDRGDVVALVQNSCDGHLLLGDLGISVRLADLGLR